MTASALSLIIYVYNIHTRWQQVAAPLPTVHSRPETEIDRHNSQNNINSTSYSSTAEARDEEKQSLYVDFEMELSTERIYPCRLYNDNQFALLLTYLLK